MSSATLVTGEDVSPALRQLVCRVGHVTGIAYAPPSTLVVALIAPCPKCGTRGGRQ